MCNPDYSSESGTFQAVPAKVERRRTISGRLPDLLRENRPSGLLLSLAFARSAADVVLALSPHRL